MSIRKKLSLLMLILGLVPTIIVGSLAYVIISHELTSKTIDQLSSVASKQESRISALLQNKMEESAKLSNLFALQNELSDFVASGGKNGANDIQKILFDRKNANSDIQLIHLIDINGGIIAKTNSPNSKLSIDAKSFVVPADQERTLSVQNDQSDGMVKIVISSKIYVNKKAVGYLGIVFRADDITAAVQDYTGLNETGETLLAAKNSDGKVLSMLPLRFDTDGALTRRLDSLDLFNKSDLSGAIKKDYRSKEVMVVTKTIASTDWRLAIKMDTAEALSSTNLLRDTLVVAVSASSLLIVSATLYITRLFTKPILEIARVSQQVGYGNLRVRVRPMGNDEVGELARSINSMVSNIESLVGNIDLQRKRLEVILDSTTDGILAVDQNGLILLANQAACRLIASSEEALVGKNVRETLRFTQDHKPFMINHAKPGVNAYLNLQYDDLSKAKHYVDLVVSKVNNDQARDATQAIIIIHDQTKDRELENMKVDFVSMAAHELRTPLAAIKGYLELIVYKKQVDIETKKYLEQALHSSGELGGLINNLLSISNIERGTLTFNPEKLDLEVEIKRAIDETIAARINLPNDIKLIFAQSKNPKFVLADKLAVHEVLNNLITNAIKYNRSGGSVTVMIDEQNAKYLVTVKDTGIGMPKSALAKLFTKFYRVKSGLDSGATGTGLGLYITKAIVERHGGSMIVKSTEGVGSEFGFLLPRYVVGEASASVEQQSKIALTRSEHGWTTQNIDR